MKNLLKIDSIEKFPVFPKKKKKKNCFFESRRLNLFFDQSKKVKFSKPDLLPSSIDVRLKLD